MYDHNGLIFQNGGIIIEIKEVKTEIEYNNYGDMVFLSWQLANKQHDGVEVII